jgi:hypothetical protein
LIPTHKQHASKLVVEDREEATHALHDRKEDSKLILS